MANSGKTDVKVTTWDTLRFSWEVKSQSIASNTTTVSWKMQLIAGSSGRISSSASKAWSVTVNGHKYSGNNTVGISNNSTKTLASGTTVISHDSDGGKTFSYSFSQAFNITFSGASIGTKSGSGSGALPTISRASTPTLSASSVNMGGNVTITTNRASSSMTHDLAYSFNGGAYVSIATGVGASYTWTTPDLSNSIPNSVSGTATIRCTTKVGGASIGYKTVTLTLKVPGSVAPVVTNVYLTDTTGVDEKFSGFIQGESKIRADVIAKGANGSTIKNYSITFCGTTYSGAASSFVFESVTESGDLPLTVKVTDSRGRTYTNSIFVDVKAYAKPIINLLQAYRVNEDGAEDPEGTCAAIRYRYTVSSLDGQNTSSVSFDYKRSTDTDWKENFLLSDGEWPEEDTIAITTLIRFSADYQYDFRMRVSDLINEAESYTAQMPSGQVLLDFRADGKGLGIFKTSEREGVEFGDSPKGAVLGLWEATDAIPENGNFDDYNAPGVYSVRTNAIMKTLENRPCDIAGTLRVSSGTGSKTITGSYAYLVQEYHPYTADEPIYRRSLTSGASGVFSAGAWMAITLQYSSNGKEVFLPLPTYVEGVRVPTIISGAVSNVTVPAGGYKDIDVSFGHTFSTTPVVQITPMWNTASTNSHFVQFTVVERSKTGCTIRLLNGHSANFIPAVMWTAIGN